MMRFALLMIAVACTSSKLTPGAQCSTSDQCETGQSCLQIGEVLGPQCEVLASVCTITCGSDSDCSTLGSSFLCFESCGSAMVCGATDTAEPS
jgi:hypothetical protein